MQVLTMEQIQAKAPSVFAERPYKEMSDKYDFIPTVRVVDGLMENGFQPVYAGQSRTRIEGKENFTRHVLRFRHNDFFAPGKVGQEIPEIVLLNSHDGSSSFQVMLGIFRLVCSNGMIVKSGSLDEIRVRHMGSPVDDVIEASYEIIENAPKAIQQIENWKGTMLERPQQEAFAKAAMELRGSTIELDPFQLLAPRRMADKPEENGTRDLWRTMNVIQENYVKGGIRGRDKNNRRRAIRGIKSVDADTKFNRALWKLTEEMEKLV